MNRLTISFVLALSAVFSTGAQNFSAAQDLPAAKSETRPISLVADSVDFDPDTGILIAQGNVQVFRGTKVLSTDKVIYDQRNKHISIPGPLILNNGANATTRAKRAELDIDIENGLIEGAELLIAQQIQLVSERMYRQNGRFKVLDKVVASTCYICAKNPIPFWKIRARRVIHDEDAKRLYFEDATLDVLGFPVFYSPKLRIPDPTVSRASGVLVPKFSTSTTLGYGVSVPYYWTLGDHADLTLTADVFTRGSFMLNPHYRRYVKKGYFELNGYFTLKDSLTDQETRSSLSASGLFQLPKEIELEFGVELASDNDFRDDYDIGIDNQDRLTSFITLRRTRKTSFASISASRIQSLRTNEVDENIPVVLPEIYAHKNWVEPIFGGKFGLTAQSVTLLRENSSEFSRFGLTLDWQKEWILRSGLIVSAYGGVSGNSYYTRNIPGATDSTTSNLTPTAALDFRLPLSRQNGPVTHVIEPRVQFVWSPNKARTNVNEDSLQLEFENNNLFSYNRFPGFDATERGLRANIGISYTRYHPEGWTYGVTLGRVFRAHNLSQFGAGTGLDGRHSNYVSALTADYKKQFTFSNRMLFDEDFDISKNETQLAFSLEKISAQATYVWLDQNVVAGASDRTHEASLGIQYQPNDYWTYSGQWRQNLETGHSTSGEFGLQYENECVAVNLSYSLQFSGSGIVRPKRTIGLTVELAGLGNKKQNRKYAHRCSAL